jgi:hypothetical protein
MDSSILNQGTPTLDVVESCQITWNKQVTFTFMSFELQDVLDEEF